VPWPVGPQPLARLVEAREVAEPVAAQEGQPAADLPLVEVIHKAFPHDLQIVPLPRFGAQPSSGMGSWQWGITSNATDGDAVWKFLDYLLQPAQVLKMSNANGSIPATL
jgi:ABC-type glycerol-3-phosphate transport system substrate-binding protein